MKKIFFFLFIGLLFAACDSSNEIEEPVRELKLSVENGIYIDDIDFEFEILDGNGDYIVSVSDEGKAKATIEGTTVKVNLFYHWAKITISDKKQQTISVTINSTAESIVPHSYGLSIADGDTYTMKHISFGVGKYTIEKIKGTSAEATVDENDNVKVTTLQQGNTYFKLTDHRGVTATFDIFVMGIYDLTENTINVNAVNDQTLSVLLMWGDGDWQFVETPSSPIIENVYLMPKADMDKKYDILQIDTSKGDVKGSATIQLKDKSGNIAIVSVNVE